MPTIHYVPRSEGGYQPYAKLPSGSREVARGESNSAVVARGSDSIRVVDDQGNEQFRHQVADFVQRVQYQPGADRYLVQDWSGIDVISAQDGRPEGRITPDKMDHQSSTQVLSDGRLMLNVATYSENGQLMMLNPDLSPAWNHPTELLRARALELPGGGIAASDGRHIEVCDAAGKVVHRTDKAICDPVLKDGQLIYLEAQWMKQAAGRVAERSNSVLLTRHDLASGVTVSTPTSDNCERVTPLPDGRFLLSERAPGRFALVVHDAQGKLEQRFKLPGVLYQLELSGDGKRALALEGDPLGTPPEFRLHQLDLETMRLAQVYRGHEDTMVTALSDGNTALFTPQGAQLLEDGRKFGTPRELLQALGPDVHPANRAVESRTTAFIAPEPGPAAWDGLLNQVSHRMRLPSAAAEIARPGEPFGTPDGCVNFMLPGVDALPAAVAAASRTPRLNDLFRHDGGMPKWLDRQPTSLTVTDPSGKSHALRGDFTHVLPFMAEGRPVVAAAARDRLFWWDPLRNQSAESYDLGGPISSLEPARDRRSVVARTTSGQVLHLVPESIEGLQTDSEPQPEDRPAGGGLQVSEDGIRLPGVFIRRAKK